MSRDCDGKEKEKDNLSWDTILPDELLQQVFSFFPIADIIKLGTVCKHWYEVVHSRPSLWTMMAPQKPWFFLSSFNNSSFSGYVCDPCSLRWYNFDFPRLGKGIWRTSSSCGLACLMDPSGESRLLVGNPIKRDWKQLPQVPAGSFSHFNAIALSFDRRTRGYTVVVAKCACTQHLPGTFGQWHLFLHKYQSTTKSWATPFAQDLGIWIGSNEAVICDGVLYYFIRRPGLTPHLMAFDLMKPSLLQESIPAPFPLHDAQLINLSNKLVVVGTRDYYPDGELVILELEDKTWREVAQLPMSLYKMLRDNSFLCCGAGYLLFFHSPMWPALLTFDMRQKVWRWLSHPYTEQMPFCFQPGSIFNRGFCFEARLDVSS